jgi:tetratricopeptide (TPR) repeat protein
MNPLSLAVRRRPRLGAGLAALALALALACQGASIEEIRALQDAGSYEESIEPLRAILSGAPDDAEANYRLGLALVRTGRSNQALWPLRKAADSAEFGKDAGTLLASTLLDLENLEEAIRAADRVLEADPSNLSALTTRTKGHLAGHFADKALADSERVLELDPKNIVGHVARAGALIELGRVDEADRAFADYRAAMADQGERAVLEACLTSASFVGKVRKDVDRSAREVRACIEGRPVAVTDLQTVVGLLDGIGRAEDATAVLEERVKAEPANLDVRAYLAMRLSAIGKAEEADALLLEGVRDSGNPGAWSVLAGVRRSAGDLAGAREALEKAFELAPAEGAEPLRFSLADVLVDAGDVAAAEELARGFKEPLYRDLILARVAQERGDSAGALKLVDAVLIKWPNNDGARMVAARAASELGDVERTMSELREATRIAPDRNDAALLLARYMLAQGKYPEAFSFAQRHSAKRGFTGPEAALIAARAQVAEGKLDEARKTLEELAKVSGQAAVAAAELGRVEAAAAGAPAGVRAIERSGLDLSDPANEPALRQLVELRFGAGQGDQALADLAALVRRRPDSAALRAIQGQAFLRAGRVVDARAAFAAALERDPANAVALGGRGLLALQEGQAAEAEKLLDQAAAAAPSDPLHPYVKAAAAKAQGRPDEAEKLLRDLVHRFPEFAPAANDLALLLAERNQSLDFAAALADRARRLAPGPEVLDTVGFVELRRGRLDAAKEALEQSLAANPGYATARYHLGLVLAARGERDAAIAALRQALGGGPFPEADDARTQLAALEGGKGAAQ